MLECFAGYDVHFCLQIAYKSVSPVNSSQFCLLGKEKHQRETAKLASSYLPTKLTSLVVFLGLSLRKGDVHIRQITTLYGSFCETLGAKYQTSSKDTWNFSSKTF